MNRRKAEICGSQLSDDEEEPQQKKNTITQRPDRVSLYHFEPIIALQPPPGARSFPFQALLHDVDPDGNCAFRAMAAAL
jgi:hypothetical protein